jgi:hypothetical protein
MMTATAMPLQRTTAHCKTYQISREKNTIGSMSFLKAATLLSEVLFFSGCLLYDFFPTGEEV